MLSPFLPEWVSTIGVGGKGILYLKKSRNMRWRSMAYVGSRYNDIIYK